MAMDDSQTHDLLPEQLELLRFLEDLQQNNPAEYAQMQQQLAASQAAKSGAGQSVTVLPTPGFVAKTRSITAKGRKVFINLCTSELIDRCAEMNPADPLPEGVPAPSDDEYRIRIPVSLGPPREDLDKTGGACTVYDVVFHPSTLDTAQGDKGFCDFMMQVVATQIQQKYSDELSIDFTFPKLMNNYKGISPLPQFIRAKPKTPAAEGGGFAAPAAPMPIIEEVPTSAADADAAIAALPAPAYVLRPLDANGAPMEDGAEAEAGEASEDALARAPARLELKVHLPALAAGGKAAGRAGGSSGGGGGSGVRRPAPASAVDRISVQVSAWDVRVLVTDLYMLALELPHAVHSVVEDCCLETERCILTIWLRVLGTAEALEALDESAAGFEASKAQAEAWEAQLNKEARARKARQLLEQKRKEAAMEKAAEEARREAEAEARRKAKATAGSAAAPAQEGESRAVAARKPAADLPPSVPPITLVNSVMFELE